MGRPAERAKVKKTAHGIGILAKAGGGGKGCCSEAQGLQNRSPNSPIRCPINGLAGRKVGDVDLLEGGIMRGILRD